MTSKGAFSHTKNRSQIEICHKFEEGNGVIICERFRDKSIKNWICKVFVSFTIQFLWVFTSLFEAFSCFDFCQKNLVKENSNLWQISLFFCMTKCTFKVSDIFVGNYCLENFEKNMTPQPLLPHGWDLRIFWIFSLKLLDFLWNFIACKA